MIYYKRAKVVVIVLDLKQVLTTGQIWEEEQLENTIINRKI